VKDQKEYCFEGFTKIKLV